MIVLPLVPGVFIRHLSAPDSGLDYFAATVDAVYATPCAGCGHTLDDHGTPYGPAAAFRRDQCLACPCPGFRRAAA